MAEQIVTFTQRPDLRAAIEELVIAGWQTFMLHDTYANQHWDKLYTQFADFQFMLLDGDDLIAVGNSIAVRWDGSDDSLPDDGWDAMLVSGMEDYEAGATPDTLCALSITIRPSHLGRGISQRVVRAMRDIAKQHSLKALIAPVRPTQKSQYPLIPMEQYITWKRDDGMLFDPWLRTHARLGARVVKVSPQAMLITGSIAEWQEWTQMTFPGSGQYIIPDGLVPVTVDLDRDQATYIEPNVWMVHPVR